MGLRSRISNLFLRSRVDREIQAELEAHIALRTEDNVAAGMPPDAARRDALLRFGNPVVTKERAAGEDAALSLATLGFDLKYVMRQLKKSPGFAFTVVITLALGIGSNAAIFSLVNAVLRHPAGVDHPERVAVMHVRYLKFTLDLPVISVPDYTGAASLSQQVETAAVESGTSFNIVQNGVAKNIAAARVSSKWFQVFGAQPILGRTFTADEDQPNAGKVVVLSYGIWQRAFGGDHNVIGQTLNLDEKPYRVIGVMRSDFAWPRRNDVWVPIALPPSAFAKENMFNENYQAVARLRPGVTVEQLNAALGTLLWQEVRPSPAAGFARSAGWSVYCTPLTEYAAGPLRKPLFVLSAVVLLVLLIASANVAGLFLARSSARSKEIAIQMALGASAGRMVRQLFLETFVLAAAAGAVGAAVGPLTGKLLLQLVPNNLADGFLVKSGPETVIFTVLMAFVTMLIAGMGPAYGMMLRRGQLKLGESERNTTASAGKQRLRSAFVISEVAAAFLLLTGTGLFLASLFRLQQVDPGFNPRGVATGKVNFSGDNVKKVQERQAAFVSGVVGRLAAQPGVSAAAAVEPLPFDPGTIESCSFNIVGQPNSPNEPGPHSQLTYATADYLKVMQIPLLAGRWIGPSDVAGTEPVTVIDSRLANHYWPGANAIGQHISFGCDTDAKPALVVGVVAPIRLSSLEEDTSDGMRYYPFAQDKRPSADFLVRSDGNTGVTGEAIKQAVAQSDSSQAVSTITSLETLVSDSLAGQRLIVWLLGAFATLALLLAMIGIYGLISFVTSQRTREVGIRMALGAHRGTVLRLVLTGALVRVGIGLVIGICASAVMTLMLRHVFVDFGAGMLSSLSVATGILMAVGALAGLIPANRAASINPVQALRTE